VEISKRSLVGWLGDKTVENIGAREAVKRSAAAVLQYIRYRGECIRTRSSRGRPHSPRINNRRDFRALHHRLVNVVLSAYFSGSLKVHRLPPPPPPIHSTPSRPATARPPAAAADPRPPHQEVHLVNVYRGAGRKLFLARSIKPTGQKMWSATAAAAAAVPGHRPLSPPTQ